MFFLMERKVRLTQILESSMACWQHLDMTCPQHVLTNGVINPNTWNKKNQCNGHGWKIIPLVFDISNSPTIQAMLTNNSLTCKAMAILIFFVVSKKSMVTWQGSHLSFNKCTMKTNVSIPILDIHKSKLILQEF